MPRKKRGPGRPVTTNSRANPLIVYRVSTEQLSDLRKAGKKRGLSEHQEAKRRAFPTAAAPAAKESAVPPVSSIEKERRR